MTAFTSCDLTRCQPVPRVVPVAEGVWELAFPIRERTDVVAEVRVVVTAAQAAAIGRLMRQEK